MTHTRRNFSLGLLAGAAALAGCGNGIGNTNDQRIDARVDDTLNFMTSRYPGTQSLRNNASGVLVMPLITEAGLGFGGSYGRGALRVDDITVDYYSAATAVRPCPLLHDGRSAPRLPPLSRLGRRSRY